MAAAAMELGGAVLVSGMNEPKSSALVDLRRSLPLNVRPLRRGAAQAVLTAEPVSSFSSAPSSAGWDGMNMGGRTSYLADVKRSWRRDESEDGVTVTQEKLDRWLRDSISERNCMIVRNIRKAPLLVHMFSDGEGANVRVESEAASPDIWSRITKRWNQEKRMPDGVVLVEELCRDGEENQTWGLLVQGRGAACPACYILNTCRVPSACGFCTHFCLIVRNIRKAPLLVHMFSDGDGANVRVESEAASPDIWSRIAKRWNQEKRTPDGVVLVEELCRDGVENQTWGLLVQGRGVACPACYILNTCRVPSVGGFCTHFCLVRAECYGESAEMQLMRAWSR